MVNSMVKKVFLAIAVILSFSLSAVIIIKPFLNNSTNDVQSKKAYTSEPSDIIRKADNPNNRFHNLSTIYAKENRLTNTDSENILLKGIMPPDLMVLKNKGKFNREFFQKISDTGANVVRIPVHPDMWIKDKDYLKKYIAPAVNWCQELGMYAIIDLHYIGNIVTGEGEQMPDIGTKSDDLAMRFWTAVSDYFKDTQNVIFELCNEPTNISSQQWSDFANELTGLIRKQGAGQLIIVGGISYSQDLSWVSQNPINDSNIAYASHIYPIHSKSNWDRWFGNISNEKPVIITEWGFIDENRNKTRQQYLVGDEDSYGNELLEYLEQKNIGWVACWFDDTWEPQMFKKGSQEYNNYGRFVAKKLF